MNAVASAWGTMVLMELYDVMRSTPAVREFTDDPLPDDILARILDNARFAPTGGNRQGVRVVVLRDKDTRAALAALTLPVARRYAAQLANGESPWNPLQPPGVDVSTIKATEAPPQMSAPLRDAPVVLVICLDLAVVAATDQDLDRIGVIPGASVYPFVWNVLLAARNEGYGGVLNTAVAVLMSKLPAPNSTNPSVSLTGFLGTKSTTPPVVFFPNRVPCGPAATCTFSKS